jgi:hypothetical protein
MVEASILIKLLNKVSEDIDMLSIDILSNSLNSFTHSTRLRLWGSVSLV